MTFFIGDVEVFRDPVHGFIQVDEVERDIINTKAFQRLRNISQLAFTKYVYHGAEHSRFGHSLGVMEFATKVFEKLRQSKFFPFKKDKEYRKYWRILRLAALLHDVGHGPFSHAGEAVFPKGLKHEEMSRKIILETEICQIIDEKLPDKEVTAQEVGELIVGNPLGKTAFLANILSGPFDVDKMDYLLRDSLFSGVFYGRFDWERLLHTFTLYEDEDSGNCNYAIKEGGCHAAEAMVLARYFMFTQVYFHKVRRVYDLHLGEYLKELKEEEPSFKQVCSSPQEFVEWNDDRIKKHMLESSSVHANAINERKHFKLVAETSEHPEGEDICEFDRKFYEKFRSKFKDAFFDRAKNTPYKYTSPGEEFYVVMDDGKPRRLADISALVKSLKEILLVRIYVPENKHEKAKEFWKNL